MRKFTRHATSIPIDVHIVRGQTDAHPAMINLSIGGLCCNADNYIPLGTLIDITIPQVKPVYRERGVVAWCRERPGGKFEIGVSFDKEEKSFRTRMVEQVCQIEQYKQKVHDTEGRYLSSEEAAQEWIEKYAATFDQDNQPH